MIYIISTSSHRKCPLYPYSWRFSRYSAPTHWLVHGHMTSNNETVSRQMPWAGNIAKTMTSNGKQFTVTREMLTVAGISARYSKFAFVLFCYITNHLMTGPLGNSEFSVSLESQCFPRLRLGDTLRFSGNKIVYVPLGTSQMPLSHCPHPAQAQSVVEKWRKEFGHMMLVPRQNSSALKVYC